MKRRGNNEGSITKRSDGRWMGQVSMPDGSRRTAYGKTRAEVQTKLLEMQKEAEKLHYLGGSTRFRTLGEYLQTWLAGVAPSVKPRTAQFYQYIVTQYTQDIAGLSSHETKAATLAKSLCTIVRAWTLDIDCTAISCHNVADLVDPPRNARQEMRTLSAAQTRLFLESIQGDRFEALMALAVSTGMRQGELLGLTWENVDLDRGIIYVQRNMQWIKKEVYMQAPKTDKSRRMLFIGPLVRELLAAHLARQQELESMLATTWEHRWNLVFRNTTGQAMYPTTLVKRHFLTGLARVNLPRIRFHDLRHTAATLLLEAGINPKVVSEMLGHSSVSITLSLYSHATPAMHYTASVIMDKVLRGEINPLALPEGM